MVIVIFFGVLGLLVFWFVRSFLRRHQTNAVLKTKHYLLLGTVFAGTLLYPNVALWKLIPLATLFTAAIGLALCSYLAPLDTCTEEYYDWEWEARKYEFCSYVDFLIEKDKYIGSDDDD